MNNAGNLGAIQGMPGIQADQNGSRGLLLFPKKAILIWQCEMNPRALHG